MKKKHLRKMIKELRNIVYLQDIQMKELYETLAHTKDTPEDDCDCRACSPLRNDVADALDSALEDMNQSPDNDPRAAIPVDDDEVYNLMAVEAQMKDVFDHLKILENRIDDSNTETNHHHTRLATMGSSVASMSNRLSDLDRKLHSTLTLVSRNDSRITSLSTRILTLEMGQVE